jgi:phosphohistidine phosphatase
VRLILVRHAEAANGRPDALRPLTDAGRRAAAKLGRRLAEEAPDAVVSSPLVRARETAAAIAGATGIEAEEDARLAPGATAEGVRALVAERGGTVVAVGHQPDCSGIVLELDGREVTFPPAGFAVVEL